MILVRLIDRITDAAALIGVCGIPPLIAIMVWEVFSRYGLGRPTIWAFELSWMLMGGIFIMGVAYALKRREHVNVDLIDAFVGERTRAVIDALSYVLLLPCIVWISIRMARYAYSGYISGEVSGISAWNPVVWPFRAVIFLGLAVFALQLFAEFLRSARLALTGTKAV